MEYQTSLLYFDTENVDVNNRKIMDLVQLFEKYHVRCQGDAKAVVTDLCTFTKYAGDFKPGTNVLMISGNRTQQQGLGLFDIWEEEEAVSFYRKFGPTYSIIVNGEEIVIRTKRDFTEEEWDLITSVQTYHLEEGEEEEVNSESRNAIRTLEIVLRKRYAAS